jgi:putative addiction module component (TIGR02574 family)
MTLSQVLEELPAFTFEERQLLVRRVIELDDPPLSEADETLVDSRLAAHHSNPTSSVPLEALKERLRSRTKL